MGSAWKKAKRVAGSSNGPESACLDFEAFPELSAFLGGVPTPDSKGWDLQPHTITMWVEGDLLYWCLQSKQEANKLFGSVKRLDVGLLGVEEGLAAGSFSTRLRK